MNELLPRRVQGASRNAVFQAMFAWQEEVVFGGGGSELFGPAMLRSAGPAVLALCSSCGSHGEQDLSSQLWFLGVRVEMAARDGTAVDMMSVFFWHGSALEGVLHTAGVGSAGVLRRACPRERELIWVQRHDRACAVVRLSRKSCRRAGLRCVWSMEAGAPRVRRVVSA